MTSTAALHALGTRLRGERGQFVLVNVAVNLIVLVRSYVSMKVLDFHELGLVAVAQSVVLLVGACQLGVLNGGYRLLCAEQNGGGRRINDQVYSLLAMIGAGALLATAAAMVIVDGRQQALALAVGGLAGVLTLLRSWMVNQMTARVSLASLNLVNAVSAGLSIAVLAAVAVDPLLACLASVLVQPLAFAIYAAIRDPDVRPAAVVFDTLLVKRLFASGFVVFLTGVFLVVNGQVERWSIVASGGTEALGHFYLALLFVNLYAMVPTSLDSLYLPKLVRARVAGDLPALGADLGKFFLVSVAYATIVAAGTLLLARPVVGALLPAYLPDLRYVYLVLPGLVVFGLTGPLAIVFNVLIEYRFYFYAYGAGTLATLGCFALVFGRAGGVSLDAAALIRTAVNLLMAVVLTAGYFLLARVHPEFRLRFPALRRRRSP